MDINTISIIGFILIALCGSILIHYRLKDKGQGYGKNSLKALGMVIFIPTIAILFIVGDLKAEALYTLLGTIAGYVLSSSDADKA